MDLWTALLAAVQTLPNASYVTQKILEKTVMSLSQKIIAAIFQITNQERFGFYVADEHVLTEKILEVAELPMTGESAAEVKSRLPGLTPALKKIGVEVTHSGEHTTVWGPGVRRG